MVMMDSFSAEAFQSFAFYGAILIIKMVAMSPYTGMTRVKNNAFVNAEDVAKFGNNKKLVKANDDDVERIRRAHLNDMENILPFFIIGLLYCFTNPATFTANLIFKVFTFSRITHTLVYATFPMQPFRAIAWTVGFLINFYLGFKVLMFFW